LASAQDLLQPRAVELALRESPEGAIEVPGLREVEVCSLEDCLGLLQLGDRNRCTTSGPSQLGLQMHPQPV